MKPLALFLLLLTLSAWADFDDGQAAYKRGDYKAALQQWRPLADQGDAIAQNYLGWMYAKGMGVFQDHTEALAWYRRAAAQEHKGIKKSQMLVVMTNSHPT